MSEQLNIETLRQKFKEAQDKGEELVVLDDLNYERTVLYVGDIAAFVKYKCKSKDEYSVHKSHLYNWKIKQQKEGEYKVLPKGTRFDASKLGRVELFIVSDRRLMQNTRTGEIVEYNEDLLK
jgi:hypothetical protein